MFQIHLSGKGMSGRAVRYEVLSALQVEAAEVAAAHEVNKESTMAEYNNSVKHLGMQMMVRSISNPVTELHTATWTPVTAEHLSTAWSTYFNVKDTATLKALYDREHTVSQEDVEKILEGKIQLVD